MTTLPLSTKIMDSSAHWPHEEAGQLKAKQQALHPSSETNQLEKWAFLKYTGIELHGEDQQSLSWMSPCLVIGVCM